jgi:hypothetical protein
MFGAKIIPECESTRFKKKIQYWYRFTIINTDMKVDRKAFTDTRIANNVSWYKRHRQKNCKQKAYRSIVSKQLNVRWLSFDAKKFRSILGNLK